MFAVSLPRRSGANIRNIAIGCASLSSPGDAVAQMRDARGFEHPDQLERRLTRLESVEKALARTQYHRADLEIDFIDQPCRYRLPRARGASRDRDVAPTRSLLGLGVGGLDPIGDEVKSGPALHFDRVV